MAVLNTAQVRAAGSDERIYDGRSQKAKRAASSQAVDSQRHHHHHQHQHHVTAPDVSNIPTHHVTATASQQLIQQTDHRQVFAARYYAINDRPAHAAGRHLLSVVPAATNTERMHNGL